MTGTGGAQVLRQGPEPIFARVAGGAIALGFASLLTAHVLGARRGLDLLDESYNLTLAAQPDAAKAAGDVFLFGYLLHPLYSLVGSDIATYRVLGFAIVVLASAWMTAEVFGAVRMRGLRVTAFTETLVVLAVAASTVLALPRSLGYRSVALVGLMVAVAGLARMTRRRPFAGGVIAGTGAAVAFTGKPTSAALVVMMSVLYVLTERVNRSAFAGLILGAFVSLLVVMGISGMWVTDLARFLSRGYGQLNQYDSYTSIWDMAGFGLFKDLDALRGAGVLASFVVLPGAIVWAMLLRRPAGVRLIGALAGLAAGTAVAGILVVRISGQGLGSQVEPLTLVIAMVASAVGASRVWTRWRLSSSGTQHTLPWRLCVVLAVMPYIYASGTNTLFAYAMAQATVFWVLLLALVGFGRDVHGRRSMNDAAVVISMSLVLGVITLVVLAGLLNQADGQRELSADVPVTVAGGTLMLSPDDASAIDAISEVRRVHSLDASTPSMDLTGIFPGYQFELGTRPLGRPSYYGFFAGAEAAAHDGLLNVRCADRGRAWLLYAKDNPADISAAFTGGVLDLGADYDEVASFKASQGPRSWRNLTVQILRPHADVPGKLGC